MRGCLEIKSFAAGALRVTLKNFFIALASTYIARLNDEAMPSAQNILILSKQTTQQFLFGKR